MSATDYSPLWSASDEDLAREARTADKPNQALFDAICERFGALLDAKEAADKEAEELEKQLDDFTCEECEAHQDEIDKLEDAHADKVDELNEQIDHERTRIAEFAAENAALKETSKGNTAMLEQKIDATNERLDKVIDLLSQLVASAEQAPASKAKAKPKVTKAKETPRETKPVEPAPEPEEKALDEITLEDLRDALIAMKERTSKGDVVDLLAKHSGGGNKLGDVPAENHRALFNEAKAAEAA